MTLFFLFLLSDLVTFFPEGVVLGFASWLNSPKNKILHLALTYKNIKITPNIRNGFEKSAQGLNFAHAL